MSGTARRIVEICGQLAAEADRLLKGPGAAATPQDGASSLFAAIDPLYRELEALMQGAGPALVREILAAPGLQAAEPGLHRLRATYEFDKERLRALEILDSEDPAARLAAFYAQEAHWALGPELRGALADCGQVIVAGSGALPLTALAIATELGTGVTVLDRDPEAFALGMRLIEIAGHGKTIAGIEADILEIERLERYDAIVGAVLLGVPLQDTPPGAKARLLGQVVARMRPGAKLILREPHALGRLLYPPAGLATGQDLAITCHEPVVGPGIPYRSGLIVAERLELEEQHADPSALSLHS